MQEALCEIILKSEKTRKFVCDYRLKAAVKAMESMEDDLSIHTPNEIIHLDMKNIKICTMTSIPALNLQNVCISIAYKSGTITNVFVTEAISNELTKEWSNRAPKAKYIRVFGEESMLILKIDAVEYISAHSIRYKESEEDKLPVSKTKPRVEPVKPHYPYAKAVPTKKGPFVTHKPAFTAVERISPPEFKEVDKTKPIKCGSRDNPYRAPFNAFERTTGPMLVVETPKFMIPKDVDKTMVKEIQTQLKNDRESRMKSVGSAGTPNPVHGLKSTGDQVTSFTITEKELVDSCKKSGLHVPTALSNPPIDISLKPLSKEEKLSGIKLTTYDKISIPDLAISANGERAQINCTCGFRNFVEVPKGRKYSKCPKCGKSVTRDNYAGKAVDSRHREAVIYTNYYMPSSIEV